MALSYDALGRLEQIKDWLGETVFAYDGMGRMVSSTDHRGGADGIRMEPGWHKKIHKIPRRKGMLYGYDEGRRLTEIRSGSFAVRRGYNEKGQLSHTGRGNGVESICRYDGRGRVAGIEHRGGEGIREVFAYGYNILGNCIRETRQSGEAGYSYDRTYTYDALSRLREVREGDRLLYRYGYDPYGNRTGGAGPRETPEGRYGRPDYVLDCLGRLESIRRGEGEILQENTYNGLGCRVGTKTVNPDGGRMPFHLKPPPGSTWITRMNTGMWSWKAGERKAGAGKGCGATSGRGTPCGIRTRPGMNVWKRGVTGKGP